MNSTRHLNVWDAIYASGGYEKQPDDELISLCETIDPSEALDVGSGEGRHAVWLAAHGWNVNAIDISSEGIANLKKQARKHNLSIKTSVGSIADFNFTEETYDLVISTGCALNFFQKSETKQIVDKLKSAVRVKGHIYITLSTVDDPAYQRYRMKARNIRDDSFWSNNTNCWINAFKSSELMSCFDDFRVLSYSEKTIHDTHGSPHDHVLAFIVAQRSGESTET
jgi:2-polyprenyl-3-methyl-5-hydroxy-6-metoxy-1,4-benzoquinol methylase